MCTSQYKLGDLPEGVSVPTEEIRAKLDEWCAAEGVTWSIAPWTSPCDEHYVTSIDRERNPWWGVFMDCLKDSCPAKDIEPEIFPAGTDSRFIRELGIPALGFSPMRKTPVLLHDHDEFLHKDIFLEGIAVYEKLIPALAMAAKLPTEEGAGEKRAPGEVPEGLSPLKRAKK